MRRLGPVLLALALLLALASPAAAQVVRGGGGGTVTLQDEGSPLTTRSTINFTGAGVSCSDNAGAGRTDCTVSGAGGGPPAFSDITAGTNTNALVVGAAGSLTFSGSGSSLVIGNSGTLTFTGTGAVTLPALSVTNGMLAGSIATAKLATLSGNGGTVATTTGSQTSGNCVKIDANGNHVDNGGVCNTATFANVTAGTNTAALVIGAAGSLTVTGASSSLVIGNSGSLTFTGTGSVTLPNSSVTNGMLAGSISTAKLVTSGNGGSAVTTTGVQTSGNCVKWDANGNAIDNGSPCGSGSGTPGGSSGHVQFNNAGAFGGDAALTWDNTAKVLGGAHGDKPNLATKSTTYTATAADRVLLGNTTGGGFTITLPAATVGAMYRIKNIGSANNLTVARAGSDTIDGDTSVVLPPGFGIDIVADSSTAWRLF